MLSRRPSPCYCINLRRITQSVTELYDRAMAPAELTIGQYSLLVNIRQCGICSVSELAACTGLERTTLVRSLRPLSRRGWIEDLSSPGQRSRKIHLTCTGEQVLTDASPLWDAAQAEVEQLFGSANLEALARMTKLFL